MTVDGGAFSERLRACRAAAGMSQEELAGRSGVSVRAIGDMERGRTRWPNRDTARRLADALGLTDQERAGFLVLARRPVAGSAEPVPVPVVVPYQGLSAFGEQDAGLFFGREEATAQVLGLMSASLGRSGLVVVSGVSGAGKSSLLAAGVLPRLRRGGLGAAPEAATWPALVFTPGISPLTELAVRIAPLARADAAAMRRELAADPAGFALTARQAALAARTGGADAGPRRVVLIVDQCEQLFTACPDPGERQAFIAALCAATSGTAGRCPAAVVVLVVRADFEARLADFPPLAAAVQDRYLLTAMTKRQLRLAITRPAIAAGSAVEEDLVQVLLEETAPAPAGAGAGALPLLSHVLDQAWRTRTGTALALGDYERAGGIEGAVAASAQRAYQALTGARQEVARQVFTRLTAVGADGTDTAVPAARADLTAGGGDRAADVEAVLERFAAERLLTLDAATVAISHEVLLSAWPLLRDDWLADSRTYRVTRTRLHATATEWTQASRDPSYLYTGTRLDAAAAAAARISADSRQLPLSQADQDFLAASHRASHRRARTRHQLTALLLALIAALTAVFIIAVRAGQQAAAQRDIAVSNLLISQSEASAGTGATASRLEAIAAYALDPSAQARYALLSAAANPQVATIFTGPAEVVSVAFSPDGKILATGCADGLARFWDVASGQETGKPIPAGSSPGGRQGQGTHFAGAPVAFSPDGTIAAATEPDGVQLWDVTTGQPTGKPLAVPGATAVAFSPDGKTLAISGPDAVQLWDVTTGQPAGKSLAVLRATAVAFSPDGTIVATAEPDGVQLWDVTTSQPVGDPLAVLGSTAVAFSPDGKTLATAEPDGVQLWDVTTGQPAGMLLTDGSSAVDALAFSPDGKTLATGGLDGTARLWDTGATTFRQSGSQDDNVSAMTMAFSPDGTALASASLAGNPPDLDADVQLLNVAAGYQTGKPLTAGPLTAWALALGPGDTTTLAASSASGVRLLDSAAARPAGRPFTAPHRHAITAIALSQDGKTLAICTDDGTAQLWDVPARRESGKVFAGASNAAVFSPDLKTLAAIGSTGITLWNMTTGHRIGAPLPSPYGSAGDYPVLVFSPDGKMLAVIGYNGITLRDAATGQQAGSQLATAGQLVTAAAFSPDNTTLATGGPDGITLWDLATGQQIGHGLTAADGPVDAVAFSPDGKTLAAGSQGITQLWNVSYLTSPLAQLCERAGGSLTPASWASYVQSGTPYRNACPPTGTR